MQSVTRWWHQHKTNGSEVHSWGNEPRVHAFLLVCVCFCVCVWMCMHVIARVHGFAFFALLYLVCMTVFLTVSSAGWRSVHVWGLGGSSSVLSRNVWFNWRTEHQRIYQITLDTNSSVPPCYTCWNPPSSANPVFQYSLWNLADASIC